MNNLEFDLELYSTEAVFQAVKAYAAIAQIEVERSRAFAGAASAKHYSIKPLPEGFSGRGFDFLCFFFGRFQFF